MRVVGSTPLFFTSVYIQRETVRPNARQHLQLCTVGVLGICLCNWSYLTGLYYTAATNVVILDLCIVVWVTLGSLLLKREVWTWSKGVGILTIFVGAGVMVSSSPHASASKTIASSHDHQLNIESFNFSGNNMKGNMFVILMTFGYSTYLLAAEGIGKELSIQG